jgi:hypothetical protein
VRARTGKEGTYGICELTKGNNDIMLMKIKLSTFLLGGAAFAIIGAAFALAQAVDPRIQQYDKGPATINVSGYHRDIAQHTAVYNFLFERPQSPEFRGFAGRPPNEKIVTSQKSQPT